MKIFSKKLRGRLRRKKKERANTPARPSLLQRWRRSRQEKPPRRPRLKFTRSIKLLFLVLVIILIAEAGFLLTFRQTYRRFRRGDFDQPLLVFALARLNSTLAGTVKVDTLSGDPLGPLTLTNVVIRDPEGQVMIQVGWAKLEWTLFCFRTLCPEVRLEADNLMVNAIKAEGRWNFRKLRKPKPSTAKKRPARLPPLSAVVTARRGDLHLVYPPNRVVDAWVTEGRGEFKTWGNQIHFNVTELQAAVENPALGVNHLEMKGTAYSTDQGWDFRAEEGGRLITASSRADMSFGHYYMGVGDFEADFTYLEAAPDALSLFWPNHQLALLALGKGWLKGNRGVIAFHADSKSEAGQVSGGGAYDRIKRELKMQGMMKDFSLGKFLGREYSLTDLTGVYQLEYRAKKEGPPPSGTGKPRVTERYYKFDLILESFQYPSLRSFPATAVIEVIGEKFKADVASPAPGTNFKVAAAGGLDAPYPLELSAEVRDLNPAALHEGMPEGGLSGGLKLNGIGKSMDSFSGRGEVTGLNGQLKGYEIKDANLAGQISRGRLTFDRAVGLLQGVGVNGQGWIEPKGKNVPFNFELELAVANAADLSSWTKGAVSAASANFKVILAGNKVKWTVNGSGNAGSVRVSPFTAPAAALQGELTVENNQRLSGKLTLEAESVAWPEAHYADFRLPGLSLHLTADIQPSRFDALKLRFDLAAKGDEPGYGLMTKGDLATDSRSKLYRFDFSALELDLIGQNWKALAPAVIESKRGELRIQGLALQYQDQKIGLDGPLQGQNLDLALTVANFELDPWTAKLMPGDTLAGDLTTQMTIKGPAGRPEVQGGLTVEKFQYREFALDQVQGTLHYQPETLEFALSGQSEVAKKILADGQLPLRFGMSPWVFKVLPDPRLSIKIEAPEISGAVLTMFFPWLQEVSGQLSLSALIKGSIEDPLWNGQLRAKGVKFTIPGWGLSLRGVHGEANIVDNLITIPEMAVRSGEGSAKLSGTIRLKGFLIGEMNLALDSDNFQAMNTPDIKAVIAGHVTLKGDLQRPRIGGKITLADLFYRPPLLLSYQGIAWEKDDPTIVVKGKEVTKAATTPFMDRSEILLQIAIPDTAKLRSSELNVRMGGDLEVKKPPGGFFLIFGKITAKEGWVIFQGKPFKVEKGEFMFPAIPVIDPDLNILASYKVPDYTTYIKIGGTLSQPTLEIYSEPPLDPADVLAVILFGRPVSQLAPGQRQSLAQSGGQLVTGYAAAGLANSLTDALGLDALIVQAGDSPETSGIGVGKYLNDQLYLFYYQRFGAERAAEFKLRYELRKNLSIEAGQDDKGQGGADIYVTHPY